MWTPVFVCAPHSPGTNTTTITDQTSSSHVIHRRVIAAADIEDFAVLNCSVTFSADYRVMSPDISVKPAYPVYDFVWKTPAIRIVNASGKYEACE